MEQEKLTIVVGSYADVPKNLLEQIKDLERLFTVDQAVLKKITAHFVKELEKGPKPPPINRSTDMLMRNLRIEQRRRKHREEAVSGAGSRLTHHS